MDNYYCDNYKVVQAQLRNDCLSITAKSETWTVHLDFDVVDTMNIIEAYDLHYDHVHKLVGKWCVLGTKELTGSINVFYIGPKATY